LFALFLLYFTHSIHAQGDLILKPGAILEHQYQWWLLIEQHTVNIYDSLGQKTNSINMGNRFISSVSSDKDGTFIINCTGDVEFSRIAICYSKTGKELWRYNYQYQGDGGIEVSPDGKYAVLSTCTAQDYILFSTSDPKTLLKNPMAGLDSKTTLISQFAADGSLIIIAYTGMLYRYDYFAEKITAQKELKTSTGIKLVPIEGKITCNSNKTLFSTLLINIHDTTQGGPFENPNWVLVFDSNLNIKLFSNINERVYSIKLLDSLAITTRLDRKTSHFICSIYRNQNSNEEIIDSNLTDHNTLGTPFLSNNSLFFYMPGQKNGIRGYDLGKRRLTKGVSSIPLFKAKTNSQKKTPLLHIND
jgi:hypothetical protein